MDKVELLSDDLIEVVAEAIRAHEDGSYSVSAYFPAAEAAIAAYRAYMTRDRMVQCPSCDGSGCDLYDGAPDKDFQVCHGQGTVAQSDTRVERVKEAIKSISYGGRIWEDETGIDREQTLAEFVEGTWIAGDADDIFSRAALAAIAALGLEVG